MKNSVIGLGILTLLISFILLNSGAFGDKKFSAGIPVSQEEFLQDEARLMASEIDLQEGILSGRSENTGFYLAGRKFPALLSFLFLLMKADVEEIHQSLMPGLAYNPVKDLPVFYLNLRI